MGKFRNTWESQTNLGKRYGLSAITVGKELAAAGLRDAATKLPTQKAIDGGFAQATPLKDGTPFFMWHIDKVAALLGKKHKPLSEAERWAAHVREMFKEAERASEQGQEKASVLLADMAYEDVPEHLLKQVEALVNGKQA